MGGIFPPFLRMASHNIFREGQQHKQETTCTNVDLGMCADCCVGNKQYLLCLHGNSALATALKRALYLFAELQCKEALSMSSLKSS